MKDYPDPAMAKNYVELLALLKEQQKIAERGIRQSPDDFWKWGRKGSHSLRASDRSFWSPITTRRSAGSGHPACKSIRSPDQDSCLPTGPQNDKRIQRLRVVSITSQAEPGHQVGQCAIRLKPDVKTPRSRADYGCPKVFPFPTTTGWVLPSASFRPRTSFKFSNLDRE